MNITNPNTTECPDKGLGLFGGTFDPIHLGHINTVKHAATWLGLKQVRLLPAHIPPHKNKPITPTAHRVEMAKIVCLEQPLFTLDTRELSRNKPSYTVDTLHEFKSQFPEKVLYFFIGMDSLLSFTKWYQYQEILTLCHLVVTTRPGYELDMKHPTINELSERFVTCPNEVTQTAGKIFIAPDIEQDISSTQLRQKLSQGQYSTNWLPKAVASYIKHHGLYLD